jgi:hypothetical protein
MPYISAVSFSDKPCSHSELPLPLTIWNMTQRARYCSQVDGACSRYFSSYSDRACFTGTTGRVVVIGIRNTVLMKCVELTKPSLESVRVPKNVQLSRWRIAASISTRRLLDRAERSSTFWCQMACIQSMPLVRSACHSHSAHLRATNRRDRHRR